MSAHLVAAIIGTMVGLFATLIVCEIHKANAESRDIRKQVEGFYNKSECFNNACSKLAEASNSCSCSIQEFCEVISKALGGRGNEELYEIYDDVMQATPINAEAHLVDKSGLAVDWSFANQPLTTIEMHEPSCKCAYCGCTNDHICGTCDYCGAPLEG